jgi:hypothetical protein
MRTDGDEGVHPLAVANDPHSLFFLHPSTDLANVIVFRLAGKKPLRGFVQHLGKKNRSVARVTPPKNAAKLPQPTQLMNRRLGGLTGSAVLSVAVAMGDPSLSVMIVATQAYPAVGSIYDVAARFPTPEATPH